MFAPLPTFSESKQAITLPFSTWQLLGGCANLHSSSPREQFPRWNCRQTSRVSHLVSRTAEMFNAISEKGCDWKGRFVWFRFLHGTPPHFPAVGCTKFIRTTTAEVLDLCLKDQMSGQSQMTQSASAMSGKFNTGSSLSHYVPCSASTVLTHCNFILLLLFNLAYSKGVRLRSRVWPCTIEKGDDVHGTPLQQDILQRARSVCHLKDTGNV